MTFRNGGGPPRLITSPELVRTDRKPSAFEITETKLATKASTSLGSAETGNSVKMSSIFKSSYRRHTRLRLTRGGS